MRIVNVIATHRPPVFWQYNEHNKMQNPYTCISHVHLFVQLYTCVLLNIEIAIMKVGIFKIAVVFTELVYTNFTDYIYITNIEKPCLQTEH